MLKPVGDKFTAEIDGKIKEVNVYMRDSVVTQRVDLASLKVRKADLEKELDEVNQIILEIVAAEA